MRRDVSFNMTDGVQPLLNMLYNGEVFVKREYAYKRSTDKNKK